MTRLATVGVYGFDAGSFLAALRDADVRLLADVRQRRGVRGPEYSWANAQRLQRAMRDAGIDYQHLKELAPTTELRELQYRADAEEGVGKRNRTELAPAYIERYTHEVLDDADLARLHAYMPREGTTALLCVETDPEACHRSLIAERISAEFGVVVTHLRPNHRDPG